MSFACNTGRAHIASPYPGPHYKYPIFICIFGKLDMHSKHKTVLAAIVSLFCYLILDRYKKMRTGMILSSKGLAQFCGHMCEKKIVCTGNIFY